MIRKYWTRSSNYLYAATSANIKNQTYSDRLIPLKSKATIGMCKYHDNIGNLSSPLKVNLQTRLQYAITMKNRYMLRVQTNQKYNYENTVTITKRDHA